MAAPPQEHKFEGSVIPSTNMILPEGVPLLKVVTTFDAIPAFSIVKIVELGGVAVVRRMQTSDDGGTMVVGVTSQASSGANDKTFMYVGAEFTVIIANKQDCEIGDKLAASDRNGQEGRAKRYNSTDSSPGIFGVATSAGSGNSSGTVTVTGLYGRNEIY